MGSIRDQIEEREVANLSAYATLARDSRGRIVEEELDPLRTCFMRDRDRIVHSKAFRRLKHKTQVFIDPEGDHYRTRLTHTLEVAQIARTIGRALRLNEDLIEAIALSHDVGHPPFGHAGEFALDDALVALPSDEAPERFHHAVQSLRTIDIIEPLNLSIEVRDGIGGHSKGRKDLTSEDASLSPSCEAAVVRIADRIAYLNHDIDDAVRAEVLPPSLPEVEALGDRHSVRVNALVLDVITHSLDSPEIIFSKSTLDLINHLKEFLFENVYTRYPVIYPDIGKAQSIVKELFLHYVNGGRMPDGYQGRQGAVDYVAGMTDRFAVSAFRSLRIPDSWPIP